MTLNNDEEPKSQASGRHKDVNHKSLLQSDPLSSVYPREQECLKELRNLTTKHPLNHMAVAADEGQFLNMLVKLINAKNTLEIGVFTGYSLLATALVLPQDGKILALDVNQANYELGFPVIEKAGVAQKIDFREGPALPVLDHLLITHEKNKGGFDFVFVDADKENYLDYHKRAIELVKVGGVIAYDNTLWNGSVADPPEEPQSDYIKYCRGFVMELNKALSLDSRIQICQLSIGDGLTLCRRII